MSGTARILARLRQGPATAAELYGLHCIVHSRISELRKQGHRIVCEHTPGETGPGSYVYRLDGSLRERGAGGDGPLPSFAQSSGASPSRSLSDPLADRGRGATAATADSSHDPALGDGEDGFATGAPQSSPPPPGCAPVLPSGAQLSLLEIAA